ncbi:MAG: hypothetical protein SOZ07_08920 [Prevotella sp.]|nr:hypothetical protein [Prevotella sp.]
MRHFDYSPLYKEIRTRQRKELVNALQKFPNHEFHFGTEYIDNEQKEVTEFPYIIGYLGEEPTDLKVLAVKEDKGFLSILVRDEKSDYEGTITEIDFDIVLGHLENILDCLPFHKVRHHFFKDGKEFIK